MIYFTAYYWLTISKEESSCPCLLPGVRAKYWFTGANIGNVDTDIFVNEIKDLLNNVNFIF